MLVCDDVRNVRHGSISKTTKHKQVVIVSSVISVVQSVISAASASTRLNTELQLAGIMHQAFAYTQTTGTYTSGFDVSTEARLDKLLWIYVSQHITTLT